MRTNIVLNMSTLGSQCIIGAGVSGLTAIKCCLDEELVPCCFESMDDIGGLWNYNPERKRNGFASVSKSTVTNNSKEMMGFSDLPFPKHFPMYMHNSKVLEYLRLYAKEFDLLQHIRFGTLVTKVSKTGDSKWMVQVQDQNTKEIQEEIFDAVIVCVGHFARENVPRYPGEDTFQGQRIHTREYTDHVGFEDKRVVVVGIGNSGGDVAAELGTISKQVYLSTRSGAWVLGRLGEKGYPLDMSLTTRILVSKFLPDKFKNTFVERKLNKRFDHARYGLKPSFGVSTLTPIINDELPNRIASGTVKIKPEIERITATGVQFDDGTCVEDIDVIIYATGYKFSFPFLDLPELHVNDDQVKLYKNTFPLTVDRLALIGHVQPIGSIMPVSELQCRLATRVFKDLIKLPSVGEMEEDIRSQLALMTANHPGTRQRCLRVQRIPFMDDLASIIGCKPDIGSLFLSDFRLAKELLFGPCTPYHYRLQGPGAWKGAREMILTQWERTNFALESCTNQMQQESSSYRWITAILIPLLLIVICVVQIYW